LKFKAIFANDLFYTTIYKREEEFKRVFEQWQDAEYLDTFFNEHSDDLTNGFYGVITCDDAILRTRDDAKQLGRKIESIAALTKKKLQKEEIEKLFVPLDNKLAQELRVKAHGLSRKSWLRLYAIKFDETIIITGGTIKLTATMNERAHTKIELEKLRKVKDYLIEQGVCDRDGFTELISEL
jgi:hypothetical protein